MRFLGYNALCLYLVIVVIIDGEVFCLKKK